jgi:hypothetical protein
MASASSYARHACGPMVCDHGERSGASVQFSLRQGLTVGAGLRCGEAHLRRRPEASRRWCCRCWSLVTAYQASKLGQAGAHAAPGADAPRISRVDRSRVGLQPSGCVPAGCEGDRPFRPSVGADVSRKRLLSLANACGCQKSASPVSCGMGQRLYTMIGRVPSPALPDARPVRRLVGPARSLNCLQGHRAAGAAARSRRAAPHPSRAPLDWADRVILAARTSGRSGCGG